MNGAVCGIHKCLIFKSCVAWRVNLRLSLSRFWLGKDVTGHRGGKNTENAMKAGTAVQRKPPPGGKKTTTTRCLLQQKRWQISSLVSAAANDMFVKASFKSKWRPQQRGNLLSTDFTRHEGAFLQMDWCCLDLVKTKTSFMSCQTEKTEILLTKWVVGSTMWDMDQQEDRENWHSICLHVCV